MLLHIVAILKAVSMIVITSLREWGTSTGNRQHVRGKHRGINLQLPTIQTFLWPSDD
jgi:hypothetical protein